MFQKSLIIFAIIILVLSPTPTYSATDESFYCQTPGTSSDCCFQLAHRVSTGHNSHRASIVLTNNSGYNMTLGVKNLEDGRWVTSEDYGGNNSIIIDCQPRSLLDNESETISSVTSHFFGGLTGYVTFNIHDNMSSTFTITWKVPAMFGSPQYEFNFFNESSYNDYEVTNSTTFENTVYQVTMNKKIKTIPIYNTKPWKLILVILSIVIILVMICYCCICCINYFESENPRPGPANQPGPAEYWPEPERPAPYWSNKKAHRNIVDYKRFKPGPPAERY